MGTIYRHTQVSRATQGAMGIAWAAVVWWSVRVSGPAPVATAELRFDDGHRFRVGSDDPDKLAEALLRGMRALEDAARG